MAITEWLIGSEPLIDDTPFVVTVGANAENMTLPGGAYYLWDNGSNFDLVGILGDLIATHPDITTCSGYLGRDRLAHFAADVPFDLAWGEGSTAVRELLGFAGDLTPAAPTFAAPGQSYALWSPGKRGITSARLGHFGRPVYDSVYGGSANGPVRGVTHASFRRGDWQWKNVPVSRVWSSEAPGEFIRWWMHVVPRALRFKLALGVDELDGNTSAFSYSAVSPPLQFEIEGQPEFKYKRSIKNVESRSMVELDRFRTVPEYV